MFCIKLFYYTKTKQNCINFSHFYLQTTLQPAVIQPRMAQLETLEAKVSFINKTNIPLDYILRYFTPFLYIRDV